MGLPASQQRVLDDIEVQLVQSDPRLESLFAVFTRLTAREAMPWREQISPRRLLSRVASLFRRSGHGPVPKARTAIFLPAALATMVCALVVGFGFMGVHRPSHGTGAPTAKQNSGTATCRLFLAPVSCSSLRV